MRPGTDPQLQKYAEIQKYPESTWITVITNGLCWIALIALIALIASISLPCWSVILCVHGSDVSPIMCFDKKSVNLVALAKSVHMLAIRPPPSPSQGVSERLSATVSKLNVSMLTTSVNAVISFQTFKHCFTGSLPSKWASVGLLRPDNASVPSWSSSEKCPEGQALPETWKG